MLHFAVQAAFDELLLAWRTHHHRQRTQAGLADLATSRLRLDTARDRMHQLRLAVYPEADERESIAETVWCESLGVVVYLRWSDQHPTRPGNFQCVCGHLIPIHHR